jgi:hypothetical protein
MNTKEMNFEKMENVNGGWSEMNTVEAICLIGPYALFWFPAGAFALRGGCTIFAVGSLLYAASE